MSETAATGLRSAVFGPLVREETAVDDHRRLGRELDLFDTDPLTGTGLPYRPPAGAAVRHALESSVRDQERLCGQVGDGRSPPQGAETGFRQARPRRHPTERRHEETPGPADTRIGGWGQGGASPGAHGEKRGKDTRSRGRHTLAAKNPPRSNGVTNS
jgi:hypothetical protein